MTRFISHGRNDARRPPRGGDPPRTGPATNANRWLAAALITLGLGLGLAPQIAQAETAHPAAVPTPPDTPPATATESTVLTPATCDLEVVVDEERPAPSTTLPGTCLLSAAHGTIPDDAATVGGASGDLPATGSSTGTAAAVAASILTAGAALWFMARRPRAS